MTDAHTLAVERCLGHVAQEAGQGQLTTHSCCGARLGRVGSGVAVCRLSCSAWNLPRAGVKPVPFIGSRFFTTGPAWIAPKITFFWLLSLVTFSYFHKPHLYHVQEARAVSPAQLSFAYNSSSPTTLPSPAPASFPRHAGICSPGSVPSLQTCANIVYLSLY